MNDNTKIVLEVAAIITPLGSTIVIVLLGMYRRVTAMEIKIETMWQWFLRERINGGKDMASA